MGNFIEAFNITNKNEGGYANNPDDHGGETYAGISRKNWPDWDGWKYVDLAKEGQTAWGLMSRILNNNDRVQQSVQQFYKQNFWDVLKLDQINDQQICNTVYDFGVNSGTSKAAKTLQLSAMVYEDGIIGNNTISAVNSQNSEELYNEYNERRRDFYETLAKNPNQAQFLNSWLGRLIPYKS